MYLFFSPSLSVILPLVFLVPPFLVIHVTFLCPMLTWDLRGTGRNSASSGDEPANNETRTWTLNLPLFSSPSFGRERLLESSPDGQALPIAQPLCCICRVAGAVIHHPSSYRCFDTSRA